MYILVIFGCDIIFSIIWEEAILGHLWQQNFITWWSKEQQIGNPFRWCLHPLWHILIKFLLTKKKEKDVYIAYMSSFYIFLFMLMSILAAGILSFLCGKEVVIQQCLLKVRFLIPGFISYVLLFIIVRGCLFIKINIYVEQISLNLVGGVIYPWIWIEIINHIIWCTYT